MRRVVSDTRRETRRSGGRTLLRGLGGEFRNLRTRGNESFQDRGFSGGIGNAISALSGLGAAIGVSTRVGRDNVGEYLTERWRGIGADTSGVVIDESLADCYRRYSNHVSERTPFFSSGAIGPTESLMCRQNTSNPPGRF